MRKLQIDSINEIYATVKKISNDAHNKLQSNSQPPGCWCSIVFSKQQKHMDQNSILHMFRSLGTYKIGPEKLRLGNSALIEISDESGEFPGLTPTLIIEVSILLPSASFSPLAVRHAEKITPILSALLSSCIGTPVNPEHGIFPVKEEKLPEVVAQVNSNDIPELDFQGLPIWRVLQNCQLMGAGELADRLIGALMAYEAGMLQRTDHSTLLFFVSAIEALTVPNLKSAQTQRLSKRFCYFLDEFASEAMDRVMSHKNFEQAFGKFSSRKKFAEELYNLRSKPVHTGHFGNYSGMNITDNQSLKVGLVNDVVTGAILALIDRPVSLLWGHPKLDPTLNIRLEPSEYLKLEKKAKNHHRNVDEYVKYLVLKNIIKPARY